MAIEKQFYSPEEFGRLIGRCRTTVITLLREGVIHPSEWVRIRKRYYIQKSALDRFIPSQPPRYTCERSLQSESTRELERLRERLRKHAQKS